MHWGHFCDNLRISQLQQGLNITTLVVATLVVDTADGLINIPHQKPGP